MLPNPYEKLAPLAFAAPYLLHLWDQWHVATLHRPHALALDSAPQLVLHRHCMLAEPVADCQHIHQPGKSAAFWMVKAHLLISGVEGSFDGNDELGDHRKDLAAACFEHVLHTLLASTQIGFSIIRMTQGAYLWLMTKGI